MRTASVLSTDAEFGYLPMTEDWSPRGFYRTMRCIFSDDRENLVEVPFRLYRPLSNAQFRACARHYIDERRKEYIRKLMSRQQGHMAQNADSRRWPNVNDHGISREGFWTYEKPLGMLYFAVTADKQRQARQQVRKLSQRGPIQVRSALSKAVQHTPQVKRQIPHNTLLEIIQYRAKRQFVWAFLRHETSLNRNERRKSGELERTSQELAKDYSYLRMSPKEIADGLLYSHQADKETAEKFRLSESTVRSLISKSIPR